MSTDSQIRNELASMYEKMRSPEAREAHKLQVKIKQRAEFRKNNTGVA